MGNKVQPTPVMLRLRIREHPGLRWLSWDAPCPPDYWCHLSFNVLETGLNHSSDSLQSPGNSQRGLKYPGAKGPLISASPGFLFLFSFIHLLPVSILLFPPPLPPHAKLRAYVCIIKTFCFACQSKKPSL